MIVTHQRFNRPAVLAGHTPDCAMSESSSLCHPTCASNLRPRENQSCLGHPTYMTSRRLRFCRANRPSPATDRPTFCSRDSNQWQRYREHLCDFGSSSFGHPIALHLGGERMDRRRIKPCYANHLRGRTVLFPKGILRFVACNGRASARRCDGDLGF